MQNTPKDNTAEAGKPPLNPDRPMPPLGQMSAMLDGLKGRDGWITFLELHWLRAGHASTEVVDYCSAVEPVAEKNGFEFLSVFEAKSTLKGDLRPEAIFLYRAKRGRDIPDLQMDPEYARMIPTRQALYDWERRQVFAVEPLLNRLGPDMAAARGPRRDWVHVVDFVDLRPGATYEQVAEYARWLAPLLDEAGGEMLEVYRVITTVEGSLKPGLVFVFRAPSAATLRTVVSSTKYQANIPSRDKIFEFSKQLTVATTPILGKHGS